MKESTAEIDSTLIEDIVKRILSVSSPDRIILFGSAANGNMTPDSDIDLLIITSQLEDRRGEYFRTRRALKGIEYPFDIFFLNTKQFQESKDIIGGIAYPAHKHGKVIYDAI